MKVLKYKYGLLLFFALYAFAQSSLAARPVIVNASDAQATEIAGQLELFIDVEKVWTAKQLFLAPEQFHNIESTKFPLDLGISDAAHWLKFTAVNTTNEPAQVYLEANAPEVDFFSVYAKQHGALVKFEAGDLAPQDPHHIQVPAFTSLWSLPPGDTVFLVRVQSYGFLTLPLTLYPSQTYIEDSSYQSLLVNIFRGISFGLMMFHLFLYIQTKDKVYLLFAGMVATGLTQHLYAGGVAQLYLTVSPSWNDLAPYFYSNLYVGCVLFFHSSYLKLDNKMPKLNAFTLAWASSYLLCALIWIMGYKISGYYFYTYTLIPPFLVLSSATQAWRGNRPAKIYLLATVVPVLMGLYMFLVSIGALPRGIDLTFAQQLALITSLMLFSVGIADRLKQLSIDKLQAQAETAAKSVFLAKMSHEIRTPMHGVLGMSQLMSLTSLDNTQKQYNDIIQTSGNSLLKIVDDLLDFSKAEAGKLELEEVPLSLNVLKTDIEGLFVGIAANKRVSLMMSLDPAIPEQLMGDPTRIRQIIVNLVGNALKFTESGEVKLAVSIVGDDRYRFSVTDTGVGISTVNQKKLFQAFLQVSASTTRGFGGTGLGLAICHQLVELMSGAIGVDSELGRGSTFWFEIPLATGSNNLPLINNDVLEVVTDAALALSGDITTIDPRSIRQLTILVAEDNLVNQIVIRGMLNRLGHTFVIMADGRKAVDEYVSRPDVYDVILMDCEMPVMDGFDASILIRKFEADKQLKRILIIAQTAHAIYELTERCLSAGMDEHLAKPIRMEDFARMLARYY